MNDDISEMKKKIVELENQVKKLEDETNPPVGAPDQDDMLLSEAIALSKPMEMMSASYLQRRLSIGYARAARILDQLEKLGVIGSGAGSRPRKVVQ
ncbi:hypothetical protein HZB69_01110 [Candidatus Amesbacteria bacterium]|nr:hypothetical protein [Candidatus Amesbacteria bacterium]